MRPDETRARKARTTLHGPVVRVLRPPFALADPGILLVSAPRYKSVARVCARARARVRCIWHRDHVRTNTRPNRRNERARECTVAQKRGCPRISATREHT